MDAEDSPKVPIEDIFSSRGRIKILKALAEATYNELPISELCRKVDLNHSSTRSHLKVLIKSGLIEEKTYGSRTKIYRYKIEDLRARSLKSLFSLWES
jgi:DNA-binding transcriptional ArsR family regulator